MNQSKMDLTERLAVSYILAEIPTDMTFDKIL